MFCSLNEHIFAGLPGDLCACGLYKIRGGRMVRAHNNEAYYFFMSEGEDPEQQWADLPLFENIQEISISHEQ